MRWVGIALALAACNEVLGVQETLLIDAYSPPTQCPPLGTAPAFSGVLYQLDVGFCVDYHVHTALGVVVASCYPNDLAEFPIIYEGPIDGVLAPAQGLQVVSMIVDQPRLTPD